MRFVTRTLLIVGTLLSGSLVASGETLPQSAPQQPISTVSYRVASRQMIAAAPRARRVYYRKAYRGRAYRQVVRYT